MIDYKSPIGTLKSENYQCGDTFYKVADRLGVPYKTQPIICVKNGTPILRKDWDNFIGLTNDSVYFMQIPRGDTIKNILRTVAIIALGVIAPGIGSLIGGGLLGALGQAAFVLAGTFLINALLGPSVPNLASQSQAQASPTYSLDAQGNRARLLNAIPRLYGTHIMYPDFASQPYQSYENNEQYLYQLFCLGVGEYDVSRINIDQTKLWDNVSGISPTFSDVALEIIPPGGTVTLFPSNVETSSQVSGQELRNENIQGTANFSGNTVTFTSKQPNIEYLSPGDVMNITSLPVTVNITGGTVNNTVRMSFPSPRNIGNLAIGSTVNITVSYTNSDDQPATLNYNRTVANKDVGGTWIDFTQTLPAPSNLIGGGIIAHTASFSYSYNPTTNSGSFVVIDRDFNTERLNYIVFGTTFTPTSGVATNLSLENWVGPFVANPNNQATDQLKIDVVLTRGLYYANDEGGLSNASVSYEAQIRAINNLGNPITGWVTVISETITLKTTTAQRYTKTINVAPGRYEVRLRRTNQKNHDARYGNDLSWQALRAFIPDDNIYEDVTLLAIKIRASNQLSNQSSTQINVIQTGKIPVWNGTSWSAPQVTANPAWVAADILRNTVYGAAMADNRIDIAKLLTLSNIYNARGDTFNGIFDTSKTLWEALASVLLVGRTQPILVAGKVTFIRDQPRALARTVITPQSILKNTFEMSHLLRGEESADDVIVEFMDSKTWEQTEVQAKLPGSVSGNPARIQMFGVTNISQAWREGMYYAAANSYRRIFASVSTEADGRLLLKGDTVIVSHDVPKWSQSGFIMDYLPLENVLVLDRTVKFSENTNYITLRRKDGKEFGPIEISSNGYDNEVVLELGSLEAIEISQNMTIENVLSLDDESKRTTFVFFDSENFAKKFIVVSSAIRDINKVDLELVIDDARVYSADTGTPPEGVDYLGPGVTPNGPSVDVIYVNQDPNSGSDPVLLNITWGVGLGANSYILQYSPNGITWSTIYSGTATSYQATLNAGDIFIRVAAIGAVPGPWKNFQGNFGTPMLTPGIVSNMQVNADISAGVIEVSFDPSVRTSSYRGEIWIESSSGSGNFDTQKLSKTVSSSFISWNSSEVVAVGGPWSRFEVRVYSINNYGTSGPVSQQITGISLGPVQNLSLINPYQGQEANIQWSPVSSAAGYRVKIYNNSSVLVRETIVTSTNYFYNNTQLTDDGGPWRSFSVKVRAESTNLTGPESTLNITDPAPAYPANIASTSPSVGALSVTWNQVMEADVVGYRLYGSTTNNFTPGPSNLLFEGNSLGVSLTGLAPGTYYYRVMTIDGYAGGNGYNISPQQSRTVS